MKTKAKSIKPKNTSKADAYRSSLERAIRGESIRQERLVRSFPLWWNDGKKGKSVHIGDFKTMSEFFALCEDYLSASVNHVYVTSIGKSVETKTKPSRTINVRGADGIVIAGMEHDGGESLHAPFIPINPTDTEYPYRPFSSVKGTRSKFEQTTIPMF